MGNGQTRPGDQAIATAAPSTDQAHTASLSEQQWRINRPADHQGLGITPAQATGVEGTYGAPELPAARATTERLQPKTARVDAKPFIYNAPDSTPAIPTAASNTGFKPVEYGVDQKSGGYPGALLPHEVLQLGVPATLGVYGTVKRWQPELDRKFTWVEPEYTVAKHVSGATEKVFASAQRKAVPYFKALKDSYNGDPALQAAEALAPNARTTAQEELVERTLVARTAWNQTRLAHNGNNPVSAIDYRDLALDPKATGPAGWKAVQDFEKAQTNLITERETALRALQKAERTIYDGEIKAAKLSRLKDFGALGGATAINWAVDQIAPKDDPSWMTVVGDIAAPAIMLTRMSALGKWEPFVKGGVIVGTHLFTHFLLDKNVEDENKK